VTCGKRRAGYGEQLAGGPEIATFALAVTFGDVRAINKRPVARRRSQTISPCVWTCRRIDEYSIELRVTVAASSHDGRASAFRTDYITALLMTVSTASSRRYFVVSRMASLA
jgi:hypothetical protein